MSKKRCLIVDDSEVIRRISTRMLDALHLEAAEAASGYSALEYCSKAMPDAILLDWCMPELSGIDCLHMLRRLPGGTTPIVLYCTTQNDPAETVRARRAGANDILVKPYDRETLRQKLIAVGLI